MSNISAFGQSSNILTPNLGAQRLFYLKNSIFSEILISDLNICSFFGFNFRRNQFLNVTPNFFRRNCNFCPFLTYKSQFCKSEILWNISWWVSMMSSDWSIMNYVALVWLLILFGLTIIPKHEIAKVSLVSGSEKIEITKKNDSRINENNDFKLNKFRLYIISI